MNLYYHLQNFCVIGQKKGGRFTPEKSLFYYYYYFIVTAQTRTFFYIEAKLSQEVELPRGYNYPSRRVVSLYEINIVYSA